MGSSDTALIPGVMALEFQKLLPSLLNDFLKVYFMCLSVLPTYIYVHCVHTWYFQGSEEGVRCLGTGVFDGLSHHMGSGNQIPLLCKSSKCP